MNLVISVIRGRLGGDFADFCDLGWILVVILVISMIWGFSGQSRNPEIKRATE